MNYRIGVDIGGTFTDSVVVDENGEITVGKSLSTPHDFALGVLDSVRDAAAKLGFKDHRELLGKTTLFFHACTVGDNALITRSGSKAGLIATKGFGDAVLMMRGAVTLGLNEAEAAHAAALNKPEPYIPRGLIAEVEERVDYEGSVIVPLRREQAERAIRSLVEKGVESVAVALLWSVSNPAHEKAIAEILAEKYPGIFVTLSSDVAPFTGEYERTITTVFNAYIGRKITEYLGHLARLLRENGLGQRPLIMQAYGGVLDTEAASKNAIGIIESSPASGVTGCQFVGRLVGEGNLLAADMGGTTFKVGVIRGGIVERDYSPIFLRHRLLSAKVWVESIGAGGGSIAWIDPESRLLKVGPQGAGAAPGPVCYGLGGTEPTVSDADLLLGYLNEDYFLGGRMQVDKGAAKKAIEKIARLLGMDTVEAAGAIYRIANSHMSDLIRSATIHRGYDPREFTMMSFGGAGGVHASRYAGDLGIRRILIPPTASVHGATGLVSSDVVYEYGATDRLLVPVDTRHVNQRFSSLIERALGDLRSNGFVEKNIGILRSVDMRYRYQVHEVNVPLPEGWDDLMGSDLEALYDRFDELYESLYGRGSGYKEAGKEILTFRVRAVGRLPKPRIHEEPVVKSGAETAVKGQRQVYFEEKRDFVSTLIYDFDRMKPGMELKGPGVIETPVTTIVVNPNDLASIDKVRNVCIEIGG